MAKATSKPILFILTDRIITGVWLKRHLQDQFHIIQEKTEKTALDRIQNSTIDFIIVDASLKEVNLFPLLMKLKKAVSPHWIPIVVVTDNLKKAFRSRAMKAGATDFLQDPLDEAELYTRIANSLKANEQQRKIAEISEELKTYRQNLPQTVLSSKFLLSDKAIRALAKAKREKNPFTISLIRLDSFHELTERFGTRGMDKLLLIFSELLMPLISPKDILIPSKEGTFILIMPNTTLETAEETAEKIRKKVRERTLKTSKGTLTLSISIAVTTYDEKGKRGSEAEFDRMLEIASHALKKIEKTSQIISVPKRSS